jgi:DNA-binding cell septation regulator SpoVG
MNITRAEIILADNYLREKRGVLAFVKIVLDDQLCVTEIKVIEKDGYLYLVMPARKRTASCPNCSSKIAMNYRYCPQCGNKTEFVVTDNRSIHEDVTYPINSDFRKYLEAEIAEKYNGKVDDSRKLKIRNLG